MTYYVTVGQKQDSVYHTAKDCRQLKREPLEATKDDIDRMGLRECKVCAGEYDCTACDRSYHNALKEHAQE